MPDPHAELIALLDYYRSEEEASCVCDGPCTCGVDKSVARIDAFLSRLRSGELACVQTVFRDFVVEKAREGDKT